MLRRLPRAKRADPLVPYTTLSRSGRQRFLKVLAREFSVSANAVDEAVAHYQAAASDTERLKAESRLRRTLQPPRLRLLTQFNALPEGVKFLVDLRADLLALRGDDPYLQGLDNEIGRASGRARGC